MVDMKQMAANTVLASDLPHARRAGDEPRVAPDASVAGVPITDFAPEHAAAKAYLQVARELIHRGAVA